MASPILSQLLSIIFNTSIKEGIFPDALKIAKVIPFFKNGSPFVVSNYKPISLLPIFSKIFERLMHTRITEFITNNSILNEYQFGFQKNKSTDWQYQQLSIININIDSFKNKEYAHCIFLDFAKAFDTINHEIILQKLEYYGIRGKSLKWFDSYLTDRQQYTEVNKVLSDVDYIKYGVPQGSVLGPFIFLLYINDISE